MGNVNSHINVNKHKYIKLLILIIILLGECRALKVSVRTDQLAVMVVGCIFEIKRLFHSGICPIRLIPIQMYWQYLTLYILSSQLNTTVAFYSVANKCSPCYQNVLRNSVLVVLQIQYGRGQPLQRDLSRPPKCTSNFNLSWCRSPSRYYVSSSPSLTSTRVFLVINVYFKLIIIIIDNIKIIWYS